MLDTARRGLPSASPVAMSADCPPHGVRPCTRPDLYSTRLWHDMHNDGAPSCTRPRHAQPTQTLTQALSLSHVDIRLALARPHFRHEPLSRARAETYGALLSHTLATLTIGIAAAFSRIRGRFCGPSPSWSPFCGPSHWLPHWSRSRSRSRSPVPFTVAAHSQCGRAAARTIVTRERP